MGMTYDRICAMADEYQLDVSLIPKGSTYDISIGEGQPLEHLFAFYRDFCIRDQTKVITLTSLPGPSDTTRLFVVVLRHVVVDNPDRPTTGWARAAGWAPCVVSQAFTHKDNDVELTFGSGFRVRLFCRINGRAEHLYLPHIRTTQQIMALAKLFPSKDEELGV